MLRLAALGLLVLAAVPAWQPSLPCLFRAVTGWPCATCGMTRAFTYMAHGDVGAALLFSPFGAVLFVLAVLAVCGARVERLRPAWLVGALLVNWIYVLLSGVA